jgi:hypothetical protein
MQIPDLLRLFIQGIPKLVVLSAIVNICQGDHQHTFRPFRQRHGPPQSLDHFPTIPQTILPTTLLIILPTILPIILPFIAAQPFTSHSSNYFLPFSTKSSHLSTNRSESLPSDHSFKRSSNYSLLNIIQSFFPPFFHPFSQIFSNLSSNT